MAHRGGCRGTAWAGGGLLCLRNRTKGSSVLRGRALGGKVREKIEEEGDLPFMACGNFDFSSNWEMERGGWVRGGRGVS